ncbi:UPF0702 transmembrane protein YetF [Paraliobacillus ryukyuensis]|uniref:Uncharacterized membrane protein YcaP (DUF421 family) n=1 Tax=Paraliobacillus ryukyuensis TaxID=200904 RepID=A0A366ED74_9BACI|nr:uncharacterized membrane protein YcaP (DUF421 family) [Paraliobacillus ryukyuensis]
MWTDMLVVIGRIFTILPILLFITIFMGRRAIGELPVFDFLIVLTLGSVVGADIADPNIKHIHTVVAIIFIAILEKIIARLRLSQKVGHYLTFSPIVVIQDGELMEANMRKIRYSMDSILVMLRQNNVFNLKEVELAIIEANGQLSVFKKAAQSTPVRADFSMQQSNTTPIAFPIIIDGKVYKQVLEQLGVDEDWLKQALIAKGVLNFNDVFYASLTKDLALYVSKKQTNVQLPPLYF